MAVEARHLNLFPPQIHLSSRGLVMNGVEGNGNVFGVPIGYGMVAPLSGTTTAATETMVPMYGSAIAGAFPAKNLAAMKSESGVTYNVPVSRKRSRETINSLPGGVQNQSVGNRCGSFTFLGEDISFQIQQQQLEIDRFICQHTDKVRAEIEERRKKHTRRIAAAVEENVKSKLRAKEEEIEKIGKLNWALEERVKSLCVENQIWRDLAQSNEATANALRCNLEQILSQFHDERRRNSRAAEADFVGDAAESFCGSNFDEIDRRGLALTESGSSDGGNIAGDGCIAAAPSSRMCRSCGKEESCVLLLPCRHLCLCTVCGSTLHTCPVCNSTKTASVHVNLSS